MLSLGWLTGPCVPAGAGAGDSLAPRRNELIRRAFGHNPELHAAELTLERARARLRWTGRLANPELELTGSDDGAGLDDEEGALEISLRQRFPLTRRLRSEKEVSRSQILLAEAEIAERRRQLATEVDRALIQALALRERIRRERELVELNGEIVRFLQERAEVGEASPLDVTQAKLGGRKLGREVAMLAGEERQQGLRLRALLGLEPDVPLSLSPRLRLPARAPAGEPVELQRVIRQRPDYVLALGRSREADALLALERARRWEDVSVRLFVEKERSVDEPEGFERNTLLGMGIAVPLPLWRRNQGGIAQAQIGRREASRELDALEFRIRSECRQALEQQRSAYRLAREARGELLALAEQNLADFRTAHRQGQASLLQLQRAQEQVLAVRTAAVEAVADYHRAAAQVRFVRGDYPGLDVAEEEEDD